MRWRGIEVLLVLLIGASVGSCGVILGDDVHWGFPLLRLGFAVVLGIAIGYGLIRWQQHEWRSARRNRRDDRRERRAERRDDRPWNKDDQSPPPGPPPATAS